jgi:hypothetical protein
VPVTEEERAAERGEKRPAHRVPQHEGGSDVGEGHGADRGEERSPEGCERDLVVDVVGEQEEDRIRTDQQRQRHGGHELAHEWGTVLQAAHARLAAPIAHAG